MTNLWIYYSFDLKDDTYRIAPIIPTGSDVHKSGFDVATLSRVCSKTVGSQPFSEELD